MNPKNIYLLNRFTFGPKIEWIENHPKLLTDFDYLKAWLFESIDKFEKCRLFHPKLRKEPSSDEWRKNWPIQTEVSDWINSMVELDNPIREKMALFWHLHIPVAIGNKNYEFAQHLLLDSYRKSALGNFYDLLVEVADSPCTMRFLNAYYSHKRAPNQNFPRELLEIFTMGEGTYTQENIEEFSRCFTGRRTIDPGVNETPYPHKPFIDENAYDDGIKTFFGHSGNFDSYDAYKIILKQTKTATYISLRLLKYFYKEFPEHFAIESLAKVLWDSDYNITKTLQFLINQEWYYQDVSQVKNPIDLWVHFQRSTGIRPLTSKTNFDSINEFGLNPFYPKNVKGWPWGEEWLLNNLASKRIFLPLIYLQISQRTRQYENGLKDLIDKIWNPHLRLYKYNHEILFDSENAQRTLNKMNLDWSTWLNSPGNNLEEVISNPTFQYWKI